MRNFLTDVNIVGATSVYRCFNEVHTRCIEQLIEYCNKVVIMLDNYDEQAERKVLEYQSKYPEKIEVFYSKFPRQEDKLEHGQVYRRFIKNQFPIREQVIQRLHEMNKEKKIDIILYPDADEIFGYDFPTTLEWFWKSDRSILFVGFVNPFNDFKTLHMPAMFSHARIFKYREDMTSVNSRSRCFYRPFLKKDKAISPYTTLHLAYFTRESRISRDFHRNKQDRNIKLQKLREKSSIYTLDKDVRCMTKKEIKIVLDKKPNYTFGEYLDKFNIEY